MPDPIYTYTAIGFVVGVVVGIGLCKVILHRAEKTLIEARQLLNQAIDRNQRATAFYQESVRQSDRNLQKMKRLVKKVLEHA